MNPWRRLWSSRAIATSRKHGVKICNSHFQKSLILCCFVRITGKVYDYRLEFSAANSYARVPLPEYAIKKVNTNTSRTDYDQEASLCLKILKEKSRPQSSGQLEPNFDDGGMRSCEVKDELLTEHMGSVRRFCLILGKFLSARSEGGQVASIAQGESQQNIKENKDAKPQVPLFPSDPTPGATAVMEEQQDQNQLQDLPSISVSSQSHKSIQEQTAAIDLEQRSCRSAKLPRRRRQGLNKKKRERIQGLKTKIITHCPHTTLPFYAKGMCKNCYHHRGRAKLADKCLHTDRANYAHGVCKNCYFSAYHKERLAQNKVSRIKRRQSIEQVDISIPMFDQ